MRQEVGWHEAANSQTITNDPNGQSSRERVRVIGAENLLVKSHLLHSLKMFQMGFDSRWSVSSSSSLSEFISCSAS